MPLDKITYNWFVDSLGAREHLVEATSKEFTYRPVHEMPTIVWRDEEQESPPVEPQTKE